MEPPAAVGGPWTSWVVYIHARPIDEAHFQYSYRLFRCRRHIHVYLSTMILKKIKPPRPYMDLKWDSMTHLQNMLLIFLSLFVRF
jgi:hypothetical protein